MSAANVFSLIGGEVNTLALEKGYTNACAARVSRALNYSGVVIPYIPKKTYKGSDNKYYFLGARKLHEWMKKTFLKPDFTLNSVECGSGSGFAATVAGKKGIYTMLPNDHKQFKATGHADIYTGFGFNGKGYFTPTGGLYSANLWVLD